MVNIIRLRLSQIILIETPHSKILAIFMEVEITLTDGIPILIHILRVRPINHMDELVKQQFFFYKI